MNYDSKVSAHLCACVICKYACVQDHKVVYYFTGVQCIMYMVYNWEI